MPYGRQWRDGFHRTPDVHADPGSDLFRELFTRHVVLSDGGVYDNLGLEPVFKRYDTVLVSDGGAKMARCMSWRFPLRLTNLFIEGGSS
jgi:hypothetical protein